MQAAREGDIKALIELAHDVHHNTNTNPGSCDGYKLAKALAVATNNDNIQAMAIIIKVFSANIHLAVANPKHPPPLAPTSSHLPRAQSEGSHGDIQTSYIIIKANIVDNRSRAW